MRYHEAVERPASVREVHHVPCHAIGSQDPGWFYRWRLTTVTSESRSTHATSSWFRRALIGMSVLSVLAGSLVVLDHGGPLGSNDLLAQAAKRTQRQDGKKGPAENPFPNRPPAPSLDGGEGWLNVAPGTEINLRDLRGKVVLLDFWTYCCINCMHVLPDLKYLEKKYAKELVVIGVHSAKFENEKNTEAIRRAILRYEIEHPVINDANMTVWRKFGANSWPTMVLIDPEGRYVGQQPGEGNRELFDKVIGMLVDYHKKKGTLDTTPVRFDLESNRLKSSPLKFPGKITADLRGKRLFISDTNHNRIVITGLDGTLQDIVGTGSIGRKNGRYADASFDHPQGTVLIGDELYVADTENHMIRVVDLAKKTVRSLAGTGQQARFRATGGPLRQTALNSPWALAHLKGTLYIAMAGPHQLWSHKLGSSQVGVFAGTGREDITDGPLDRCALAQPSSLATDGTHLFVADSEGSAIRQVDTVPGGQVKTVVGAHDLFRGRALFEFGDIDGVGDKARLQHPLGVAFHKGTLYVADSYNHKIKTIDLKSRKSSTFLGNGKRGTTIEPARFAEPGGLTVGGETLYVADTNNHRILTVDIKTGKTAVLKVAGLKPPTPPAADNSDFAEKGSLKEVTPQSIQAGKSVSLAIPLPIPDGFKLSPAASIIYRALGNKGQEVVAGDALGKRRKAAPQGEAAAKATLALTGKPGKATVDVAVSYQVCRDGKGGLCKLLTARWRIPIVATGDAKATSIQLPALPKPKANRARFKTIPTPKVPSKTGKKPGK